MSHMQGWGGGGAGTELPPKNPNTAEKHLDPKDIELIQKRKERKAEKLLEKEPHLMLKTRNYYDRKRKPSITEEMVKAK